MNNYETAVNATTTAYNSQNSAMMEQRMYAQSYEYMLKSLGASTTELALTMESKLVGSAMYLAITSTQELVGVLNNLFDTFGVLPVIALTASTAFSLFGGSMKEVLSSAISIGKELASDLFKGIAKGLDDLTAKFPALNEGINSVVKGLGAFKSIGIIALITLAGYAIEKMINKWAQAKKATEEARIALQDSLDTYNSHGQDISKLVQRYEELNQVRLKNKDAMSIEEEREYNDLVSDISRILPQAISHIDAQGQAHLKSSQYIKEQVSSMDELVKSNKEFVKGETSKVLSEHAKTLFEVTQRNSKAVEQLSSDEKKATLSLEEYSKQLETSADGVAYSTADKARAYEIYLERTSSAVQKSASASLSSQYEMTSAIQETLGTIGEQSIALMNSSGAMENVSSTAEAMIRNYASQNEQLLVNAKTQEEYSKAIDDILERNLKFGEVVSGIYDDISEGLNGINVDEAIGQFDALVDSLPREFFQQSLGDMQNDFKALSTVITDVMSGADIDIDKVVQTLVNAGMESDLAKKTIINLGTEFKNNSIKTAMANDELTDFNEELVRTRDVATEAIDPLATLFGTDDDQVKAIESRIKTLQIYRDAVGKGFDETSRGKQLISELAEITGQSEAYVTKNLDKMGVAFRGLGQTTVEWSDKSQKWIVKYDDKVDKQTRNFLNNLLSQTEVHEDFVSAIASQDGVVIDSKEKLEKRLDELSVKMKKFAEAPNDDSYNAMLTELQTHLRELDGSFVVVEDSAGKLRLEMANGVESEFFNSLNKKMEEAGLTITDVVEGAEGLYEVLVSGPDGTQIRTLASVNEQAKRGDFAVARLKETFKVFSDKLSEEKKAEYFETLKKQVDMFGENLVTVKDETGKLKLQFADGSSNLWLENLNKLIGDYNLKLETTQDEMGNVSFVLKNNKGEELFSSAIENTSTLSDELDRAKKKASGEDGGPIEIAVDGEKGKEEAKDVGKEIDKVYEKAYGAGQTGSHNSGPAELKIDGTSAKREAQEVGEEIDKAYEKAYGAGTTGPHNSGPAQLDLDGNEAKKKAKEVGDEIDKAYDKAYGSGTLGPHNSGPAQLDLENTKAKEIIDEVDKKVDELHDKVTGKSYAGGETGAHNSGAVALNMDGTKAIEVVKGVGQAVDEELNDKKIDLEIDPKTIDNFNDVVKKIAGAQSEVKTTQQKVDAMNRDLRVSGESLETIMKNVSTITDARNAVIRLIDELKLAREHLGHLYSEFADARINTSGISKSATKITEETEKIKKAFGEIKTTISNTNITLATMGPSFNITPIVNYRTAVQTHILTAVNVFKTFATAVPNYMNQVNQSYVVNSTALNSYRAQISSHLMAISNNFRTLAMQSIQSMTIMSLEMVKMYSTSLGTMVRMSKDWSLIMSMNMTNMSKSLMTQFLTTVTELVKMSVAMHNALTDNARKTKNAFVASIRDMSKEAVSEFRKGTTLIVSTASSLPSQIGNGIRNNMASATNSMTSLAKNMVTRFKRELGIHSPSRVFTELGGFVIEGLVNGLSDGNLTNLGQNVFSDFSDGAIRTIDQIKSYMTFEPVTSGSFGAGFTKTSGFGPRKSPGGIGSTNHKGVDFGAPTGTPIRAQMSGRVVTAGYHGIRGNYVIVESGNGMRQVYQHNSKNLVKAGQTIGRGQVLGLVGSTGVATGPHLHYEVHINGVPVDPTKYFRGFAKGGIVESKELAWHGEEGPEAIIPLISQRRERGLDLWTDVGERFGFSEQLLELVKSTQRRTSAYGGRMAFGGLDGEAGSGDGEGSATSGIVRPDINSIARQLGIGEQPMFTDLANPRYADQEKPEALYKRNMTEVNIAKHTAMVTRANTEMKALTEQTLKYRNALEEVSLQETRLRNETQKRLKETVARQSAIEKELGKLRDTGKHTVEQRKRYNELQQEFDKNAESIYGMENQIRQLNIAMDERKVAVYKDYIGQLTSGFADLREKISETMGDLQFALDKLSLVDEDNVGGQLKIQYDILRESMRMESTLMNNMNSLQKEYNKAVSKYGKDSEQALLTRKELKSVEDSYQKSVIDRIKKEKEIESTRRGVADEGIKALKDYYKQTQSMTEKAIDLERKSLEKAHEHKMSLYDEEISKIESVYDTRLKEMDEEKAEEDYQKTIADLNEKRTDLMTQISRASRDTTLEGRKRLSELQKQLAEANDEIESAQTQRQDELYRKAIEKQKQEQIDIIKLEKEKAEEEQKINLESLDKQIQDAKNYADKMINDERMWKEVSDRFVSGDTNPLALLMNEMQENMARYMSGNFKGISMGYDELSNEDKASFQDDTLIDISNSMLDVADIMKRFVSTSNERVQDILNVSGGNYNAGAETNFSGSTITTQGKTAPNIPAPPKPAPKPVADNRHYTVKKGDTLWDLAQKYYGNPYQWTKIAQANTNPDPRKLQIGRKLIIPFDTGGLTGDWIGDEGRIALLHKKELVLNQNQTKDILNVAKIVEKVSSNIPKMKSVVGKGIPTGITNNGDTFVIDNLSMDLKDFTGSKEDARRAFDNMAKELKKRGKR